MPATVELNRPAVVAVLIGALLLLSLMLMSTAGCASRGQSHGRVGGGETTRPEARSARVLPVTLTAFADEAADKLITELPDVRHLRDTEGRVTVLLGDLNNRTRNVSTNDFEVLQRQLRNNLINSDATERLQFVLNRGAVRALSERERVTMNGQVAEPEDYEAQRTYYLIGNFHHISRSDMNYYYFDFELVHAATHEPVWTAETEEKRVTR